ncbi:MAG TPA: hypothetical protein VGB17_06345 [Pyrinomonadaceae bacterium]|jgi:hypothetical protein
MKVFLIFTLFMQLLAPAVVQTGAQTGPDLLVVSFSWEKYRQRPTDESVDIMNRPSANSTRLPGEPTEPESMQRTREISGRSSEMRGVEQQATRSATQPHESYIYRAKVKNTGTKQVKAVYWQYEINASENPLDSSVRQFFCTQSIKPDENKELKVLSPLSPTKVVNVAGAGKKPEKSSGEKVVINRIEYTDGSAWQREGWVNNTSKSVLADDSKQKALSGKCTGL